MRTPKQPNHIKDAAALSNQVDRLQAKLDDYWNASVSRYMPRLKSRMLAAVNSEHVSLQDRQTCQDVLESVQRAIGALESAVLNLESLPADFNPAPPRTKLALEDAEFCVPKPDMEEVYGEIIDLTLPIRVRGIREMGKTKKVHVSFTGVDGSVESGFLTPSHFLPVASKVEDAA